MEAVFRLLTFTGTLWLCGLPVVSRLVLAASFGALPRGSWRSGTTLMARWLTRLTWIALAAVAVGAVGLLVRQVGLTQELSPTAGVVDAASSVLGERYGAVTAGRLVVVAALAVVVQGQLGRQVLAPARDPAAKVFWLVWAVLAAVLVVTLPLTGHAGSSSTPVLSTVVDTAHLVAAGVWFAGVLVLGQCVMWALRGRGHHAQVRVFGELLGRFARLAPASIALVGLTGVATSLQAVDSWDQVASTDYGALLTIKVVFFLVVLFFGALNHFVLLPGLRRRTQAAQAFESREAAVSVLRYEVACAVVLLVLTGVLTGLSRPA